jgi:hypothetical protein
VVGHDHHTILLCFVYEACSRTENSMPLESDMTLRTPPLLARLVVEKLGPSDRRESLIGDLTEQYQRGRSSLWFWRQSVVAIFVGAFRDVRRNTGHVMHAVLTGVGILVLYSQISRPLTYSLGYLVGGSRFWREVWWLQAATFLPFGFIGGVFTGWLVARFHRPQLAAGLLALNAAWIAIDLPTLWRLAPDAWGYPNYRYQLGMNLAQLLCVVVGTLVGGLLTRTSKDRTTLDALAS